MELKIPNQKHGINQCRKIHGFVALLTLLFAFLTNIAVSQTTIQTVNFETAGSGYTVQPQEYTVATGGSAPDYWTRSNGGVEISPATAFSNYQGTWFFAGEDVDYDTYTTKYYVTCSSVSISGYSNLQVKLLLGGRTGTTIEVGDFIQIQYQIDGGGYTTLAQFLGDGSLADAYLEDADANGTVDSPNVPLSAALSEFTYSIPSTGSTLQVRIHVYNGTSEEVAFDNIRVIGTAAAPEMDVQGNGQSIADGDTSPTTADHTDFGSVNVSSGSVERVFTIENTGSSTLNLTGSNPYVSISGSHSTDFSITGTPSNSISNGGSTTFNVTFDPSAAGTRSASISIANNDSDENPYNFNIAGEGFDAPSATTDAATSVTAVGATINGTVNANNLSTTVSFEYGLTDSYGSTVTADESPVTGTSGTSVSKAITSLDAYTTYHYRVVATNSGGTTNGADDTFTTSAVAATVTTDSITDIGMTTATGNGNVTDLGAPNPTQHGVCWNTGGTPTTANSKTEDGPVSATGAFTSSITGLNPNTTYYVRAYVINTAGTTYGTQDSFTTKPEPPTVTTDSITNITMTSATGFGNITDLGAPNPTEHGVCWSTSEMPTLDDDYTDEGATGSTGLFSTNMTSLDPYTTYYVRAYAINTADTAYGDQIFFTTDPEPATVTTQAVTNIGITTATGNGTVTDLGAPNPTQHGVCWNTSGTPDTSDPKTEDGPVSVTGAFTSSITGLDGNTTYFVRAYVTNTAGTTYGSQESFTTDPEPPAVTTDSVTNIGTTSATGYGNITDLGSPNPTEHGVCWSTSEIPTLSDDYTDEGAIGSTGLFSSNLTSLALNTTYYVRAYAINTADTAYGSQLSFTTAGILPTVTTQPVSDIAVDTAVGNGNITDLGVPDPSAHGVCWNDSGTPTIDDNKTDEGATSSTGAFTTNMLSLIPNTTYYVRAYATNVEGTAYGSEESFITLVGPPEAVTVAASGLGYFTATLSGNIVANNSSTTVTFEYGLTDAYGTTVTADESPVTGASETPVSYALIGLAANTTYHYRVVGVSAGGTTNGDDLTFTTLSQAPVSTSSAATDILPNSAKLNGIINANDLSTTVSFEYGLTTDYGTTVTASQSPVSGTTDTVVSAMVTGLVPNKTYHYRVVGVNLEATTNGDDLTFTTLKHDQVITFDALPAKTTADTDFDPGATSDLGLDVSYSSSNELVATIVDAMIHIVGAGTTDIIAAQLGNDTTNVATPVSQLLTVTQATSIDVYAGIEYKVYPNPVKELLSIDVENIASSDQISVALIDLTGKTIFSKVYEGTNCKVDVSQFHSGLYFLSIKVKEHKHNLKIMIE